MSSPFYMHSRLFAASLLLAACGTDVDPEVTVSGGTGTTMSPTSGAPDGTSSIGGTDTTTGETGATGETGETGDAPPAGPYELCQRYIACIAVTTPNGLPDAQSGFGDGSACWSGKPADAELCGEACATGLGQYHETYPDEPKCTVCQEDGECGAGELCVDGGCVGQGVCGNGLVDPAEKCDSQEGCGADCLEGLACSPLTNVGCEPGQVCLPGQFYVPNCVSVGDSPVKADGERCGEDLDQGIYDFCGPGLGCVGAELLGGTCGEDRCCTPYCDVAAPNACTGGRTCHAFVEFDPEFPEDNPLAYLGLCTP